MLFFRNGLLSISLTLLIATSSAVAREAPPLVATYVRQLALQCGKAGDRANELSPLIPIDLDGDDVDEWIIDASRYSCHNNDESSRRLGSQVTIFRVLESGMTVPVFQRMAFGLHIRREPGSAPTLILKLAGRECGETSSVQRCDRHVTWDPKTSTFQIVSSHIESQARPN